VRDCEPYYSERWRAHERFNSRRTSEAKFIIAAERHRRNNMSRFTSTRFDQQTVKAADANTFSAQISSTGNHSCACHVQRRASAKGNVIHVPD
jgi:hypothetical protein